MPKSPRSTVKADAPIEVLLKEKRKFAPPRQFAARAVASKASALGDTTTLADPVVVAALKEKYEEE